MRRLKAISLALSGLAVLSLGSYSILDGLARMKSAAAMADGANKFLASLTPEQKARAMFGIDDAHRFEWYFVPRVRKGVPLKELDEAQRKLALDFMKTGLGASGYARAETIRSLEPILKEIEKGTGPVRDPDLYYFSVFGNPSARDVWGWRVEGHHLSLNFTIVKGEMISTTPLFMGANPAEIREGERKGLRALAGEEDRARELIRSLDEKQRATAIFEQKVPNDIFTSNSRKADPLKPDGLSMGSMNRMQRDKLNQLLEEYLTRMPQDVADERRKKLRAAGPEKIFFAWAGGINKGDPHYYRIQGPTFLIEYDDIQNNANHIHSVWRDFDGDFGADLIREHYRTTKH